MNDNYIFLAIDGDDVGSHLEYLMIINDVDELTTFSLRYKNTMSWLESQLIKLFKAEIIFSGGDNLLALANYSQFDIGIFDSLREGFVKKSSHTISAGVGHSPRSASFALKFAKTSGKNCIKNIKDLNDE